MISPLSETQTMNPLAREDRRTIFEDYISLARMLGNQYIDTIKYEGGRCSPLSFTYPNIIPSSLKRMTSLPNLLPQMTMPCR